VVPPRYPLLLVLLAIAGCTKPPINHAPISPGAADLRMYDIEGRTHEMLRELAVCESGGSGDSVQPIYGGRGAYVGRFQFSLRTIVTYVQQMDGRVLNTKEALALGHDYGQASALAKFIIFEKDGIWNWPFCNRKLGLAKQVAEIKAAL
jgi:hypothetical protein